MLTDHKALLVLVYLSILRQKRLQELQCEVCSQSRSYVFIQPYMCIGSYTTLYISCSYTLVLKYMSVEVRVSVIPNLNSHSKLFSDRIVLQQAELNYLRTIAYVMGQTVSLHHYEMWVLQLHAPYLTSSLHLSEVSMNWDPLSYLGTYLIQASVLCTPASFVPLQWHQGVNAQFMWISPYGSVFWQSFLASFFLLLLPCNQTCAEFLPLIQGNCQRSSRLETSWYLVKCTGPYTTFCMSGH